MRRKLPALTLRNAVSRSNMDQRKLGRTNKSAHLQCISPRCEQPHPTCPSPAPVLSPPSLVRNRNPRPLLPISAAILIPASTPAPPPLEVITLARCRLYIPIMLVLRARAMLSFSLATELAFPVHTYSLRPGLDDRLEMDERGETST
jgi:hypothetical protein